VITRLDVEAAVARTAAVRRVALVLCGANTDPSDYSVPSASTRSATEFTT
jgi:hypothetical protein